MIINNKDFDDVRMDCLHYLNHRFFKLRHTYYAKGVHHGRVSVIISVLIVVMVNVVWMVISVVVTGWMVLKAMVMAMVRAVVLGITKIIITTKI